MRTQLVPGLSACPHLRVLDLGGVDLGAGDEGSTVTELNGPPAAKRQLPNHPNHPTANHQDEQWEGGEGGDIGGVISYGGSEMGCLVAACPNLTSLTLGHHTPLSAPGLCALRAGLTGLTHLCAASLECHPGFDPPRELFVQAVDGVGEETGWAPDQDAGQVPDQATAPAAPRRLHTLELGMAEEAGEGVGRGGWADGGGGGQSLAALAALAPLLLPGLAVLRVGGALVVRAGREMNGPSWKMNGPGREMNGPVGEMTGPWPVDAAVGGGATAAAVSAAHAVGAALAPGCVVEVSGGELEVVVEGR